MSASVVNVESMGRLRLATVEVAVLATMEMTGMAILTRREVMGRLLSWEAPPRCVTSTIQGAMENEIDAIADLKSSRS